MNKTKLAIFCPSSFDDYPFLENLLNKKVEEIGLIISNNSGHKFPEKYAYEKGIPILSYPIGKHLNVLAANDKIIVAADVVLVLDNGQSTNNENVRKKCLGANKKCNVIKVSAESKSVQIVNELREFFKMFEDAKEEDFETWIKEGKKGINKLKKIQELL